MKNIVTRSLERVLPWERAAIDRRSFTKDVELLDYEKQDAVDAVHLNWVQLIAGLYLLVPSVIVLVDFGKWPISVLLVSVLGALSWLAPGSGVPWRNRGLLYDAWPYLIVSCLAVWLSGVLPPFGENLDWYKHYAIFNDLRKQSWPPSVVTDGAAVGTLRYSLSYYVVPALIAKVGGAKSLYVAAYAWTALGCFLALTLAFGLSRLDTAKKFLLASVFLLCSGADIIGTYISGNMPDPPMPLLHFEWWASFGELPSSFTSLIWTPQHAIAGWISAFLVFRFPARSVRNAGIIGAAVSLWSPFCAVGLIPTLTWAVTRVGLRPAFSFSNLVLAPALLVAAGLYLTNGAAGIPFDFVWNAPDVLRHKRELSSLVWTAFVLVEFGAIAAAIVIVTPQHKFLIAIHAAFLFALCVFSVGATNDLLMRGSIPSLAILALFAASGVVLVPSSFRKVPLVVCVVIGLVTPAAEVMRALVTKRIPSRNAISLIDAIGGWKIFEPQYIVYEKMPIRIQKSDVIDDTSLHFETFGEAIFDIGARRVSSDRFVDAALVSNAIELPPGIYKLDAVLDWDVEGKNATENAAHLSLHAQKLLAPIMTSTSVNGHIERYFSSSGKPFRISFGLGGWSSGKGTMQLKSLTISLVKGVAQ